MIATQIKTYDQLSKIELYGLLELRNAVFIVEQECVYQDLDGKDHMAVHVLGKVQNKLVAYLRIFKAGDYFENAAIGRMVVAQKYRGKGISATMMHSAMNYINKKMNSPKIEMSAQTYLKAFYQRLGFKTVGQPYLEDDIPHIKMIFG
ncbi:MAG: GNAT family N-acetyltransferase [Bacteroidota bacterium]